jgi:hypothetical protein
MAVVACATVPPISTFDAPIPRGPPAVARRDKGTRGQGDGEKNHCSRKPSKSELKKAAKADKWGTNVLLILRKRLRRIMCSEWWEDHCEAELLAGHASYDPGELTFLPLRENLFNASIYPPGGPLSLMHRCKCCDKDVPPGAIGSRDLCTECYYDTLPLELRGHLPTSPSRGSYITTKDALDAGLSLLRPSRGQLSPRPLVPLSPCLPLHAALHWETAAPERYPRNRTGGECRVRVPSRRLVAWVERGGETTGDEKNLGCVVSDDPMAA